MTSSECFVPGERCCPTPPLTTARDSAILRFELAFEVAWKLAQTLARALATELPRFVAAFEELAEHARRVLSTT